jgi:hypothetical protein
VFVRFIAWTATVKASFFVKYDGAVNVFCDGDAGVLLVYNAWALNGQPKGAQFAGFADHRARLLKFMLSTAERCNGVRSLMMPVLRFNAD